MCNAMVDNPIYVEGNSEVPIYDTVHCKSTTSDTQIDRQYEILLAGPRSCMNSTVLEDSKTTLNTDRYIQQPTQYQKTNSFTKLVADTLAESSLKDIDSENTKDVAASTGSGCENLIIMRTELTSDARTDSQATAMCCSGEGGGKLQRTLELSTDLDGSSFCNTNLNGENLSPNAIDISTASSSDNKPNTTMNPDDMNI